MVDDQHVDPCRLEDGRRAQPVDVAAPAAPLLERVAGRDGLVDQQPGRLDLRVHVGQLGLHQLEVGDRPAELLALRDILERQVEAALRGADDRRREEGALDVEPAHDDRHAVVFRPEQVLRRHPAVVEHQLAGGRAAPAHLPELFPGAESGEAALDDEGRNSLGTALGGRLGVDEHHVGDRPVGDEHLPAREQVVVALAPRHRAHAAQRVRPRPGFGQAERTDPFARAEPGQVPELLRLGAVAQDVVEAEVLVRAPDAARVGVPVAERLAHQGRAEQVQAGAAVLRRRRDADEAVAPEVAHQGRRIPVVVVHPRQQRMELFLRVAESRVIESLVVLGECKRVRDAVVARCCVHVAELPWCCGAGQILSTPDWRSAKGAFSEAEMAIPSALRVSTMSMTPSSRISDVWK